MVVFIKGMKCGRCEKSVAGLLTSMGTKVVKVCTKEGFAEFRYSPGNIFPKAIKNFLIKKCGEASVDFDPAIVSSGLA